MYPPINSVVLKTITTMKSSPVLFNCLVAFPLNDIILDYLKGMERLNESTTVKK